MVQFDSDRIEIKTGNIDGGGYVKLHFGEYSQDIIAELMKIPQQTNLKVTIEYDK